MASYVELYFGKSPADLSYQDVVDFFATPQEESDKIEFKSYHSPGNENDKEKENGVIRSACGFLNSSGGLVIWGAPVGQSVAGRTEKVFTGALSPVTKLIEKDAFINRITDSIAPAPSGVNFYTLLDNGNYVYIVEVPQSEYSPHQFKNIYYMRIDVKQGPHHTIILKHFSKRSHIQD
jgi:predicted HTH transcriptional regulator